MKQCLEERPVRWHILWYHCRCVVLISQTYHYCGLIYYNYYQYAKALKRK